MLLPSLRGCTLRLSVRPAAAAATLLALTACTGSGPGRAAGSPSPAPSAALPASTPPAAPSETPSATPSGAPTPSSAAPTVVGTPVSSTSCATRALAITLAQGGGGAGSTFSTLTFTNRGVATCTLTGYPGVAFVAGADEHQVGAAATRSGTGVTTVRLRPGARATVALRMTNPHLYPEADCHPVRVNGLRVYPPNRTASTVVRLPAGTDACSASQLPGGPQLETGPVQRA